MDPYKDLARIIDQRSRQHAGRAVTGLQAELGTVTSTGLKLDGFKHEIRGYLQASGLSLIPGDRVMAVPVNHGQEIVVVCKVVSN